MPVQALNPTQVAFVNETIRPMIETAIRFKGALDRFVLDYDNQQDPIATTTDDLGDNATGDAPRVGAPRLTGQRLAQLRTLCGNMANQLDGPTLNILISLAVRSLESINRGDGSG